MKKVVMLIISLFCFWLTGCSVAGFWLSGCGSPEADLVVVNNSPREVWSITLNYGNRTHGIRNAREHALLEQGESCGLEWELGRATVTLFGRNGRELARTQVKFSGERLYLILEEDGGLSLSSEEEFHKTESFQSLRHIVNRARPRPSGGAGFIETRGDRHGTKTPARPVFGADGGGV